MTRQSDALRDRLGRYVADATQMLALEILALLRATTPIDTGAARAGWRIVPGPNGGLAVVNPEGHVRFLNYGSSTQAPAGFVEAAQIQAIVNVRAAHGRVRVASVQVLGADLAGNLAVAYNPRSRR